MKFTVIDQGVPSSAVRCCFLLKDNWNDWYKYQTMFYLVVFDDSGHRHDAGSVKIGEVGMAPQDNIVSRPNIPSEFSQLSPRFFSLGQDEDYYQTIASLDPDLRSEIFQGLRDCAANLPIFEKVQTEDVMSESLLRSVSSETVRGRFHRLTQGDATLTEFNFSFQLPLPENTPNSTSPVLSFEIKPESKPPTNVHVLIGRNAVGKTRALRELASALGKATSDNPGILMYSGQKERIWEFASFVYVAFSAFDEYVPHSPASRNAPGMRYSYVGLKRITPSEEGIDYGIPKAVHELTEEFAESVAKCRIGARAERWTKALETLESDPLFSEADVKSISNRDLENWRELAISKFSQLSSGHKIVLLTMTRLVELIDERSLVLMDEPEAHLHPPLLSAFVRALSDLLVHRNGVAIVVTHSPVVLQEVPRSCVWMLRRSGAICEAERPAIETFGENVGTLTREVFGLEVVHSGYHKMLVDAINNNPFSYDDVVSYFGGELGAEARSIAKSLVVEKAQRNPNPFED